MADIDDADPWPDADFGTFDSSDTPDAPGASDTPGASDGPSAPDAPSDFGDPGGGSRDRRGRGGSWKPYRPAKRSGARQTGLSGRGRRKPKIMRAHHPLTRESLPQAAFTEHESEEEVDPATTAQLRALWDAGTTESAQFAATLRAVAVYWPQGPDPERDLRDEAEYLVAQALRTTISHASRLLGDAHKATTALPRLLGLVEAGQLPARWMTFVLRRTSDLSDAALAELDESIAGWDLRVDEGRFSRQLSALVRWLHDQQEAATSAPPTRAVEVLPPDEDGTACLQIHGPAPEILALGRRLDSAARAVQQAQRHALQSGEEIPFDDGTAADRGHALSQSRLRYEILTRSILDTGNVDVPKERFRINVTVPVLTLLGVENGPGLLDGIHPLPAEMARELAGQEETWYRVLNDPTQGAFLPLPADKYIPTRAMLEYLRLANPVCAVPGCNKPTSFASQMDHIEEYNHRHPENGGHTEIFNLHPLCWRHHQLKTAGILDPTKESIAHPTTTQITVTDSSPHVSADGNKSPPPGPSPDDPPPLAASPGAPPPGAIADPEPPQAETVTGFDPGVTHWTTRRDRTALRAADECDLITAWVTNVFTAQWEHIQRRIAAHHDKTAPPLTDDGTAATAPDPGPPPF